MPGDDPTENVQSDEQVMELFCQTTGQEQGALSIFKSMLGAARDGDPHDRAVYARFVGNDALYD